MKGRIHKVIKELLWATALALFLSAPASLAISQATNHSAAQAGSSKPSIVRTVTGTITEIDHPRAGTTLTIMGTDGTTYMYGVEEGKIAGATAATLKVGDRVSVEFYNLITNSPPIIYGNPIRTVLLSPSHQPQVNNAVSASNAQSWTSIFPIGQRTYGLYADLLSSHTAYIATKVGLWKTDNDGMSWRPVLRMRTDNLILVQSVSTPNMLYLGATQNRIGTLLKSGDGGQNWTRIGANDVKSSIRDLVVDPKNPDWIYVLTDSQVLGSRNGGNSWGDITPRIQTDQFIVGVPCRFLRTDYSKPGYVAAGCSRVRGVGPALNMSDMVESADGGVTWQVETLPGFARSFRGAEHFNDIENNLWWTLNIHPADSQSMLAVNSAVGSHYNHKPGLVISRDGGQHWKDITIWLTKSEVLEMSSILWLQGDPNHIFLGSGRGLYESRNGGASWNQTLPYPIASLGETGSGRLFAATNFGIFTSQDKGQSWHQSSFGLPTFMGDFSKDDVDSGSFTAFDEGNASPAFKLEAYDGQNIYVGGQGGYWTSQDTGVTWGWHSVQSGLEQVGTSEGDIIPRYHGPNIRQLLIANDKTMFLNLVVEGSFWQGGSEILKSQPDGKVVKVKTPVASNWLSISASDSNTVYATVNNGNGGWHSPNDGNQLMKSEDGGFSWQTIDLTRWLGPTFAGYSIAWIPDVETSAQSPNISYAVTIAYNQRANAEAVAVLATSDGGKTWRDVSPQPAATSIPAYLNAVRIKAHIALDPKNNKALYLLLPKGLFSSADGGAKWIRSSLNAAVLRDVAVSPQVSGTVYASGSGGVWVSKDAGTSWSIVDNGIWDDRIDRILPEAGLTLAEGYNGIYGLSPAEAGEAESRWKDLENSVKTDPLGFVVTDKPVSNPTNISSETSANSSVNTSEASGLIAGSGSTGSAACNGYADCFKAGIKSYGTQNLTEAMADFQTASEADPKQGQAWYWQGIVMLKGHQINQVAQLARVWDKALSLGSLIAISACHERGMQPCERGNLMLSQKFVSFSQGNTQTFNVPPQETEPGRILNNAAFAHVTYGFKTGGKNYSFDFVPSTWQACKFDLMVQCPQSGFAEQLILAQFVAETLPKLASGAFGLAAGGETPAGPEPDVAQPPAAAGTDSHAANAGEADTILIDTDSGQVRVKNFHKRSLGQDEFEDEILEKTPAHVIDYGAESFCSEESKRKGCFSIDLSQKSDHADELHAQHSLMEMLGVSLQDFCKLPIAVSSLEDAVTGSKVATPPGLCPNGQFHNQ